MLVIHTHESWGLGYFEPNKLPMKEITERQLHIFNNCSHLPSTGLCPSGGGIWKVNGTELT